MIPELREFQDVECEACWGRGWIPTYHDDTEECDVCDGKGTRWMNTLVSYPRLLELVNQQYENVEKLSPSDHINIMKIFHDWNKEDERRRI